MKEEKFPHAKGRIKPIKGVDRFNNFKSMAEKLKSIKLYQFDRFEIFFDHSTPRDRIMEGIDRQISIFVLFPVLTGLAQVLDSFIIRKFKELWPRYRDELHKSLTKNCVVSKKWKDRRSTSVLMHAIAVQIAY